MSRLLDRRNAKRVNGLRRDPRTGAGKLAKSERGYGGVLAFDFTDNSAVVYDPTTQANVAYSQGVTDGNGNFRGPHALLTYTSPSNKLTMQSDGYYKYQAHNLVLQSENLQTTWGAGGSAVVTSADTIDVSADTANGRLSQNLTLVIGATYVFEYEVKASTSATYYDNFIINFGTNFVQQSATTDWTTVSRTVTITGSTSTTIYPIDCRGGAPTGTNVFQFRKLRVYRYPANTDYVKTTSAAKYALPLEYDTSGTCLGLLVEEARTNLALYSNGMTTGGWTAEQLDSFAASSGDGIMSNLNQFLMTPNTTSTFHRVRHSTNTRTTFTGTACYSVYAKPNGYTYLGIREDATTGSCCVFVLSGAGSAFTEHSSGAVTASGAKIESLGGGWYRCSVIMTATATSIRPAFYVVSSSYTSGDCVSATFAGDGSSGIYIALPQDEAGSFPTSPVVTYGATATRAADNISLATSAFPWTQETHSIFAEFTTKVDTSGVLIDRDTSTGPPMRVLMASNQCAIFNSGANNMNLTTGAWSSNTTHKQAMAWALNDGAGVLDGGSVATDTTLDVGGNAVAAHRIGGSVTANLELDGYIRKFSFVPRRKSDAELQTETA